MDSQYSNLPEENRKYLKGLIDRIKSETKLFLMSLSPIEKTRRIYKDKILIFLFYGIEEIKTHINDELYWENIKSDQKNKIKDIISNHEEQIEFCKKLALQIETLVFENLEKRLMININKKQHLN